MIEKAFEKVLTANDTGETGGHQAGIHIPKSQDDLIQFLPPLDVNLKNPDVWLFCTDEDGNGWQFRYIYYNNRLHEPNGTRDEYRITHLTKYFHSVGAKSGDKFTISGVAGSTDYKISVIPGDASAEETQNEKRSTRIKLRGWRRVH